LAISGHTESSCFQAVKKLIIHCSADSEEMKKKMNWAQKSFYIGFVSLLLLFCVNAAKPLADSSIKIIAGRSEPGAMLLLGFGLIGLSWFKKRKIFR